MKCSEIKVEVLRDQGCTTVLVKESLVPKYKFTGNKVQVVMANGMKFKYPEAMINVNTPFYVGETLAACLKTPIYDLVIGQIEGATNGDKVEISAVTTRQQKDQIKRQPKLKVKEVLEVMRIKDISQQQKDDTTLDRLRRYVTDKREFIKGRESHTFVLKNRILYRKVKLDGSCTDQLVVQSPPKVSNPGPL